MVDIDGFYQGSQTIVNMLCRENSDSGIVSDYNSDWETASLQDDEDYSKRLHEAMR